MRWALPPAAVIASLVVAAPASGWATQRLFDGQVNRADEEIELAGNVRGDAALVFLDRRGLRLAYARRGHAFGPARRVPRSRGGTVPRVVIDRRGNVALAWNYFDGTDPPHPEARDEGCCLGGRFTTWNPRSRRFRRVQTLTPKGREVDIDALAIGAGRAAVAWSPYNGRSRMRFARRGHALGAAVKVPGGGLALALLPSRSGTSVTYLADSRSKTVIKEARVRRGRAVGARTVGRGLPNDLQISLATNARGDQAVTWQRGSNAEGAPVFAAARAPGERFRPRRISRRGGSYGQARVAIASSGAAVIAWSSRRGKLLASTRRAGASFGRARSLFGVRRGYINDVQVAIDATGRSVFAWSEYRPRRYDDQIFAGFRSADGRVGPRRHLGEAVVNLGFENSVALDARGRARFAWARPTGVSAARARYRVP
jgi:hypothetical protein